MEGDSITVAVTRTSRDKTFPLPVRYSVSGNATNRNDYYGITGVSIIPAGSSTSSFKIKSRADAENESDKTATIKLTSGVGFGYSISSENFIRMRLHDNGFEK